ncbi:unnamed protein product [Cuscuta campestris]|uniref:Uncharacterized protein n=1 Tax=Cuscuta campestris TaxID=132261 RepID=A0A484M0E9_9ASTE|nr:unnamed protein product [Cuscuta campestris]
MNSDFEMAELHRKLQPQKKFTAGHASSSSSSSAYLFPLTPNQNLLQQVNPFPFFQEHHLIQPFPDPIRENSIHPVASNDSLLHHLSFRMGLCQEESQRNGEGDRGGGCCGDDLMQGNTRGGSPDVMTQCWETQEDSDHKNRFWKPLSTESPNGNEKEGPKETIPVEKKKQQETSEEPNQETMQNNAKSSFFDGELEAIYRWGDINAETAQATASDSALTAEDAKGRKKRKRRKSTKGSDEYRSMVEFMERSVQRLMDHQEGLHSKFLQALERLDRERVGREEARRKEEMMNLEREANARATQRALASSREAAILSYLEKMTGQKIPLPPLPPPNDPAPPSDN